MNIAVIGSGNIGTTLGRKWSEAGHTVVFGTRDPGAEKIGHLLETIPGAASGDIPSAINQAEVVLLAVPGTAVATFVSANRAALDGKIVIDATNQVGLPVMHSMALLANELPHAAIFRAFNSMGWEAFADPMFGEERVDHFFCGTSGPPRDVVSGLIAELGVRPICVGGPEAATLLDGITKLYFALVIGQGYGRRTGFRMLSD